jgi:hypothetical protein
MVRTKTRAFQSSDRKPRRRRIERLLFLINEERADRLPPTPRQGGEEPVDPDGRRLEKRGGYKG